MTATETFTAMNQYGMPYCGDGRFRDEVLVWYEARVTVSIDGGTVSATSHLAASLYRLGGPGMRESAFRRARKAVVQLIEDELFKRGEKA